VTIIQAGPDDIADLAQLLWLDTRAEEPEPPRLEEFAAQLRTWWGDQNTTHTAYVARSATQTVGMAWVAIVARVPRPDTTIRLSGDIQSVFVMPEHRGRGIGSALIEAAAGHAARAGATLVTVHSGRTAVPLYERLGFASSHRLLQRPPAG